MKRKWLSAGAVLLFFFWLSLVAASNFNLLMTGRKSECSLRFSTLITVLGDPRGCRLFWVLALSSIVLVLWMLFGRSHLNYASSMYEVVPGFKIPRPDGQGQHGTAWFMSPKRFEENFSAVEVMKLPLSPKLLEHYQKERQQCSNEKSK